LRDKLLVDAELKQGISVGLTKRQIKADKVDERNHEPEADSSAADEAVEQFVRFAPNGAEVPKHGGSEAANSARFSYRVDVNATEHAESIEALDVSLNQTVFENVSNTNIELFPDDVLVNVLETGDHNRANRRAIEPRPRQLLGM
jgi:hypothetical protein